MSSLEVSALATLFLIIFAANIPLGESLSCYVCNSRNESACANNEGLPDSLKYDCNTLPQSFEGKAYTMCRKIVQLIDFDVNGNAKHSRVIRGCGWYPGNYEGLCYKRSGMGGHQQVCSCKDDNCNAAPHLGSPNGAILAAAATTSVIAVLRTF